ncbi:lysophospholipid acyltransferase family protein [Streptomyces sp. NPDC006879]|uniref:lysophospholipid acyltransferase family protein n=1 Tax=Streptomyces sp. NPDC006879 TaxID=3364767 RepID=UPI003674D82A
MLSRIAATVTPAFGRLTITSAPEFRLDRTSIIVANHSSFADPALVLTALRRRLGIEPVVLATAGLWRVPFLGRVLTREGHVPVHRGTARAGKALEDAALALGEGRHVLLYGEGRLPARRDAADTAPEAFRSGVARLSLATGAPVMPVGQAGARRITSGSPTKQLAGLLSAPVRRPRLHVHIGAPVTLPEGVPAATARAHQAVTWAWETAATAVGHTAVSAA